MEDNGKQSFDFAVCTALPLEEAAARLVFSPADLEGAYPYMYAESTVSTSIGDYRVLIASSGKGEDAAADLIQDMTSRFSIGAVLFIGVCAGIPRPDKERDHVRLGDVVVSDGIVPYGKGTLIHGKLIPNAGSSVPPPGPDLLNHVRGLDARMRESSDRPGWMAHVERATAAKATFGAPAPDVCLDEFETGTGERGTHLPQPERIPGSPMLHVGRIGSSGFKLKDAAFRDQLALTYDIRAVEMEGYGVAHAATKCKTPYLVIKGACDYGDLLKRDHWQNYAAVVSAAFARAVIESTPFEPLQSRAVPATQSAHASAGGVGAGGVPPGPIVATSGTIQVTAPRLAPLGRGAGIWDDFPYNWDLRNKLALLRTQVGKGKRTVLIHGDPAHSPTILVRAAMLELERLGWRTFCLVPIRGNLIFREVLLRIEQAFGRYGGKGSLESRQQAICDDVAQQAAKGQVTIGLLCVDILEPFQQAWQLLKRMAQVPGVCAVLGVGMPGNTVVADYEAPDHITLPVGDYRLEDLTDEDLRLVPNQKTRDALRSMPLSPAMLMAVSSIPEEEA